MCFYGDVYNSISSYEGQRPSVDLGGEEGSIGFVQAYAATLLINTHVYFVLSFVCMCLSVKVCVFGAQTCGSSYLVLCISSTFCRLN